MLRSRSLLAPLALLLVASACGGGGSNYSPTSPSTSGTTTTTNQTPGTNEIIATTSNTFNPASLTVAKGTTVSFTFQGVTHTVAFDAVAGAPADIPATSNASVQRAFANAGTFGFHCTIHPSMTGSVIVN